MAVTESNTGGIDVDTLTAEVEEWVRGRLPAAWIDAIDRDDADALFAARELVDEQQWWLDLADKGYMTPTWPVEYGGLGVSNKVGAAVMRTLGKYKVPRTKNPIGLDLAAPAILHYGSDEVKEKFLRRIARHEDIWCQLFSEPGAGSDLASMATRAVRDGDEWVVNGQKVWTSMGDISSYGILLARTDPDVPKRQGISFFLIDMHQPGITVRPLVQITGDAEFCETFLDDARVPDAWRLGELNDGWNVSKFVLANERNALAGSSHAVGRTVSALVKHHGTITDPAMRQRVAQAWMNEKVASLTGQRSAARRKAGQAGPEGSVMKLMVSQNAQELQNLALDLEGPHGQAYDADDRWLRNTAWSFLRIRSRSIAGGTSEVQRNILGERVLGLPQEPDPYRGMPWSEVPRS